MARRSGRTRRRRTAGVPLLPFLPRLPPPRRRRAARSAAALPVPVKPPKPPRRQGSAPGRRPAGRWLRATWTGAAGSPAYEIYLPAGYRRTARVPLLLLLHGCDQGARQFVAATRFTTLADRHGFVLVAPSQSRVAQPGGCWRWYETAHQARGAGEPAVLAGITAAVLAEPARWRIDRSRVYVAGLSAGAGMALVLAAAYPDVFAAAGVHSSPPYRSATSGRNALPAMHGHGPSRRPATGAGMAPLIVVHGVADTVVHVRAAEQVVDQWLAHDAARAAAAGGSPPVTRSRTAARRSADGRSFTVTAWYTARGRKRLEYWRVDGLGHAWSGGLRDASYSDPRGPRAATAMWRFFSAHAH
jgi:poly(hydroxyalkanoate) depolymerase family esterase